MAKHKILAISSGGGHWVQMLRLRPAFEAHQVVYASVRESYEADVAGEVYRKIPDATRWDRMRLLWMITCVCWLVVRLRPTVVISTGAAPGYVAIRIAKLLGAKTIWLDSIANSEALSLSGQKISRHADLWLTQWQHLASADGPRYFGSVI